MLYLRFPAWMYGRVRSYASHLPVLSIPYDALGHTHKTPSATPTGAVLISHLPEWAQYSSFNAFLSSPEYRTFGGDIVPFLAGPAKPQVFETDSGPTACASAPVTEIFRLTLPASGSESGSGAAEKAWREFVGVLEKGAEGSVRGAIGGRSLNLEGEMWVGMVGWENLEVSETAALCWGSP